MTKPTEVEEFPEEASDPREVFVQQCVDFDQTVRVLGMRRGRFSFPLSLEVDEQTRRHLEAVYARIEKREGSLGLDDVRFLDVFARQTVASYLKKAAAECPEGEVPYTLNSGEKEACHNLVIYLLYTGLSHVLLGGKREEFANVYDDQYG